MIYKYKTSGVYIWEFRSLLNKMPEFFYKKFDYINKEYIVNISFEKQDGFFECKTSNIKEPNINFIKLIKILYE